MTLGALIGSAVMIAAGPAGPAVGLAGAAAVTAIETAGAAAAAAGATTAVAAGAATAATGAAVAAGTGAGVAGTVAGGALAGSLTAGAATGASIGAVAGPLGVFLLCFKEDTLVTKQDGSVVQMKDLNVGDIIQSQNDVDNIISSKPIYSTVTNATIINGSFQGYQFIFENGKSLSVTAPHYMMVYIDGSFQSVVARDVKINDIMCFKDNKFSKIIEIKEICINKKVNVETNTGLLYANQILTTGMCEKAPQDIKKGSDLLNYYQVTHFPQHNHLSVA